MNDLAPIISSYSPHLAMLLARCFSAEHFPALDLAFRFAMDRGGALEPDYTRPEGQSYNPRPARIGVILINDSGEKAVEVLLAGLIASSETGEEEIDAILSEHFSSSVISIAKMAKLSTEERHRNLGHRAFGHSALGHSSLGHSALSEQPNQKGERLSEQKLATIIAGAIGLDRARHRHLAANESGKTWSAFIKEIERLEIEVSSCSANLALFLKSWREKALRTARSQRLLAELS